MNSLKFELDEEIKSVLFLEDEIEKKISEIREDIIRWKMFLKVKRKWKNIFLMLKEEEKKFSSK